jgi:lysozyme family protein
MSIKDKIINEIIRIEGGYSNDSKDSGGETMYGITVAVARKYGWQYSMKSLTKDVAFNIYSSMYWDSIKLDDVEKLSPMIAEEMADTSVNLGSMRAAEFLQRSLNALNNEQKDYVDLTIDGIIGNGTIKALAAYLAKRKGEGEAILNNMLNCLQGAFYISLAERRKKDERFIYGWFKNRVKILVK